MVIKSYYSQLIVVNASKILWVSYYFLFKPSGHCMMYLALKTLAVEANKIIWLTFFY